MMEKHGDMIEFIEEHSFVHPSMLKQVMSLIGRQGGLARAKKLSQAKRVEIAKLGGLARQKKEKDR